MPYKDPIKAAENSRKRSLAYRNRNLASSRAASRKWNKANRAHINAKRRADRIANTDFVRAMERCKKFGLTLDEFHAKCEATDWCCSICGAYIADDIHMDHDHTTGMVRGILCTQCNTGIGLLGESINNLKNAALYLTKWKRTCPRPSTKSSSLRTPAIPFAGSSPS